MILRTLLTVLFASAVAAQTPPCLAFNDVNATTSGSLTGFGFAGPNTRAWQITLASGLSVQSVELFTGNSTLSGDRYMTVEVWSDTNNLPGARLAGGTWKITQSLPLRWQGANLDQTVTAPSGAKIWVVWIDPGFSEIPVETGGLALPVATRSGSTWTAATGTALKVRLFCNQLDDVGLGNNGGPCLGSNGAYAVAFTNQAPTNGNALFAIEGTGFTPGQGAFMILGITPNWPAVPWPFLPAGCTQNIDLLDSYFGFTGTSNVRGPTAAGHVIFGLPIPADPGLVGGFVSLQIAGFDPLATASLPVVTTNAVTVVVQ